MSWLLIGATCVSVLTCFAAAVFCYLERTARVGERRGRLAQRELLETLQEVRAEDEARQLLERHVALLLPGATATYLRPGEPCASLRLGREYRRAPDRERLLECERCGTVEGATACVPALTAGEPVGALLVERHAELVEPELHGLRESVSAAAPVLANLTNQAAAERRAAVDPLTCLPNSRSVRDELKRMAALAGRTVCPLSVVLLDLDHFRRVNDTFGHERGDDVLAAVGELLPEVIRASDYVGRYGGEEFLVVLPETDRDGALVLAEKLRLAVSRMRVVGVDRALTASLGVASLPADGGDGDALVRLADRALAAAKSAGGNRVEAAGLSIAPAPENG